jgi:hypothetical protein
MSVSFYCHCEERRKPIRERKWKVIQRNCNHSAFNGYHYTPSDYSTVWCVVCNAVGRTRAQYVEELDDVTAAELGVRYHDET